MMTLIQRTPPWLKWVAIATFILGAIFRFHRLDLQIPDYDQTVTILHVSGQSLQKIYTRFINQTFLLEEFKNTLVLNPTGGQDSTISSLINTDAQHPPLYYIFARLRIDWGGSLLVGIRQVSATFGLLSIPAMYWLCSELFPNRPTAPYLGVAIVAVSPLYILQSRDAREYSLWLTLLLLSSAALLWAEKKENKSSWLVYGFFMLLAIWTTPTTIWAMASHLLYLAIRHRTARSPLNLAANLTCGVLVNGFVLLTFIPWLMGMIKTSNTIQISLKWLWQHYPDIWSMLTKIAQSWILLIIELPIESQWFIPWVYGLIGLMFLMAVYIFWCRSDYRQKCFIVSFAGLQFIGLFMPAFLQLYVLTSVVRYFMPMMIAFQLILIHSLAVFLENRRNSILAVLATIIFFNILIGGSFSSKNISSQQTAWFLPGSKTIFSIAQDLQSLQEPMIVTDLQQRQDYGTLLSVSYALQSLPTKKIRAISIVRPEKRELEMQAIRTPELASAIETGNCFVLKPSTKLYRRLAEVLKYKLAYKTRYLFEIQPGS